MDLSRDSSDIDSAPFEVADGLLGKRQPMYRKRMWTAEEDGVLRKAVSDHGTGNWSVVAAVMPDRNGKQCRERWSGMLDPNLATAKWTHDEDNLLVKLHEKYGNQWARISPHLPGRSRVSLRNRWSWHVRHNEKNNREAMETPAANLEPVIAGTEPVPRAAESVERVMFAGDTLDDFSSLFKADLERDFWITNQSSWLN